MKNHIALRGGEEGSQNFISHVSQDLTGAVSIN